MGWFDALCYYCDNKPGLLSTGYICQYTGEELDEKSDLFQYGCHGGCTGYKYCPYYRKK